VYACLVAAWRRRSSTQGESQSAGYDLDTSFTVHAPAAMILTARSCYGRIRAGGVIVRLCVATSARGSGHVMCRQWSGASQPAWCATVDHKHIPLPRCARNPTPPTVGTVHKRPRRCGFACALRGIAGVSIALRPQRRPSVDSDPARPACGPALLTTARARCGGVQGDGGSAHDNE